MRALNELPRTVAAGMHTVFSDIDDTLTTDGQLVPQAYVALDTLRRAGLRVILITGRPAGWCDHIARMWPVDAVIGENGAFYYWHDPVERKLQCRHLLDTVARNAAEALMLHKTRRASDLSTRNRALEEIGEALGLDTPPLRIECYDISHLQGTEVVASMVVFEDGLSRTGEYRRFLVGGPDPQPDDGPAGNLHADATVDDTAAMREVLTRRFSRLVAAESAAAQEAQEAQEAAEAVALSGSSGEPGGMPLAPGLDPQTGRPRKFAYRPNLVVVDGGLPQVNAAAAALRELGITDLALVGLAKRLEEVWVPGQDFPIILPRTSEGLYLLQRVRDEAHRFAVTYQRTRRGHNIKQSELDRIAGIGEKRKMALLQAFGSVDAIKNATPEELSRVKGMNRSAAERVFTFFNSKSGED